MCMIRDALLRNVPTQCCAGPIEYSCPNWCCSADSYICYYHAYDDLLEYTY